VGPAGSGKSTLVGSLGAWLRRVKGQSVSLVNLDPGVLKPPYEPDVDVRDEIDIYRLMEKYELGPNGALVAACDMIATRVGGLSQRIEEAGGDVVLVDTPGQIELFAFRAAGQAIAEGLGPWPKCTLFLIDSVFCRDPLNLAASTLLASATYSRFLLPQVNVLSKKDMLRREEVMGILAWTRSEARLVEEMRRSLPGEKFLLGSEVAKAVSRLGLSTTPLPVSSNTLEGFVDLYAEVTRIVSGGVEPEG